MGAEHPPPADRPGAVRDPPEDEPRDATERADEASLPREEPARARSSRKAPAIERRRRIWWVLLAGLAWVASLGAYRWWARHRVSAPSEVAGAFTRDLFSGNAPRAYEATSRRFRSLNDATTFAKEYARESQPGGPAVEATFDARRVRGGSATFDGRVRVRGGQPTTIRVVLIEEAGAWKVDAFTVGP